MPYILLALIAFIGFIPPLQTAQAEDIEVHSEEPWAPLKLQTPYAFATAPSQKNGAAFGIITNTTDETLTISDIHSDVAGRTEIHEMAMNEGIMKMRKLGELQISAQNDSVLEPGGNHIMFMGLKEPLAEGSEISLSLQFSDGTQQEITIPVVPAGQKPDAETKDDDADKANKDDSDHTDYE